MMTKRQTWSFLITCNWLSSRILISRKLERRKDKHPRISDLRIEKLTDDDYDQAFLIYREAYYDMDAPRDKAELIGVCPKRKLKETVEMRCDYKKGVFK